MSMTVAESVIFKKHSELVEREIEGEILVIPIMAGVGDADANMYSFNNQGAAIWGLIDGKTSVGEIADRLCEEYEVTRDRALAETITFMEDLAARNLILE